MHGTLSHIVPLYTVVVPLYHDTLCVFKYNYLLFLGVDVLSVDLCNVLTIC